MPLARLMGAALSAFCLSAAVALLLGGCAPLTVRSDVAADAQVSGDATRAAAVQQRIAAAYGQLAQQNDAAAFELLLAARRIEPGNPWVALNFGVLQQRRGRPDLARIEYQTALAADGSDTKAVIASNRHLNGAGAGQLARYNLALLDKAEGRLPTSPGAALRRQTNRNTTNPPTADR